MSFIKKLFGGGITGPQESTKNYREADNMGTRILDYAHYQALLLGTVYKSQAENPGVAVFAFPDRGMAETALKSISCIKTASDTGNLISLLIIDYGGYRVDEGYRDGWAAVVHGKGLTKAVHEEAVRAFKKYGGKELANRIPQSVQPVGASTGQGKVTLIRSEDLSKTGGVGSKMIYKAASKADAIEFLKTQNINKPFFYVEIETPSGWVGKDKVGGYEF